MSAEWKVMNGVGMPAAMHLDLFGVVVCDFFDETPFLVGSAAEGKSWRDVDVRLMLDDDRFSEMFGRLPHAAAGDGTLPSWVSLCMAFSALGRTMSGLPVDFQVQPIGRANKLYGGRPRIALGIRLPGSPGLPA